MSKKKSQKNNEKVSKKIKIIRFILVVLIAIWAYVVFTLSSQDGTDSSGLSTKVVKIFVEEESLVEEIEPYVRKIAHFTEYVLGGILFITLFSTYSWTDRRKITTSILLGVWYAALDEFHQLLVPERHAGIADVWIDSLGIATGVMIIMLIIKISIICKDKKRKIVNS